MGTDHRGRRFCDGCGRLVTKIERIHGRDEYCATCYRREFVVRPCECGNTLRAHVSELGPYACKRCEAKHRTCVRCDRPVPRAGLRVDAGVVCPSCRPHYLEPKPCERCGKLSQRLSRRSDDPLRLVVCDRCRTKDTHANCCYCRRHRAVAGRLIDGLPYCATCGPAGRTTHPCPECAAPVVGGGTGRCRSCLNHAALAREVSLQRELLGREECRAWLAEFAAWLHERAPKDTALVADFLRHIPFIVRVDTLLDSTPQCTAAWFLANISVNEARRHLQFMRYLEECRGIELSEEAKLEAAEAERLAEWLKRAKRRPYGAVIAAFAAKIAGASNRPRTRRQYVSTAAAFCEFANVSDSGWTHGAMTAHLAKRPGQRANLGVFVNFCRDMMGWDVPDLPLPTAKVANTPSVKRFKAMLEKVEAAGSGASTEDVERVLELAFALSRGGLAGATLSSTKAGVLQLTIDGEGFRVPARLRRLVEFWVAERSAAAKPTEEMTS